MNYNSSVAGIVIAALGFLIFPEKGQQKVYVYVISGIVITLNCYLESRVGLLSFGVAFCVYTLTDRTAASLKTSRFTLILFIFFIVSAITFTDKYSSTQGRVFIWENCWRALARAPVTGVGMDKFRRVYNREQYDWFVRNGLENKHSLQAGNNYYAFNEWLQLAIEVGLPLAGAAFLIIFIVSVLCLRISGKLNDKEGARQKICAFISILTGSFFSYPFYYFPTLLLFICLFFWMMYAVLEDYRFARKVSYVVAAVLLIYAVKLIYANMSAYIVWGRAENENYEGHTMKSLEEFRRAEKKLYNNSDFLISYATVLIESMQVDSAVMKLQKVVTLSGDYRASELLGDIFLMKRQYEVSKSCLEKAVYLIPGKFETTYKLLSYYVAVHDTTEVIFWAERIVSMNEKIPSQHVKMYKQNALSILNEIVHRH